MQDMELQAYVNAIMDQRNSALNKLAEVSASNFALNKELQELKEIKEDSE
jgi:hypothetical protein